MDTNLTSLKNFFLEIVLAIAAVAEVVTGDGKLFVEETA